MFISSDILIRQLNTLPCIFFVESTFSPGSTLEGSSTTQEGTSELPVGPGVSVSPGAVSSTPVSSSTAGQSPSTITSTSEGSSTIPVKEPGSTSTSTEYAPPPPPPPPPSLHPPRTPRRTSAQAAEKTALVIGIIAGTMISIIIIILLVLKFKNRSDGVYKVDESKTYHASQCQSAALLGASQSPPTPQALNGSVKNGNGKPKKRELKDIKEWYV